MTDSWYPVDDPTAIVTPKKCRHPRDRRVTVHRVLDDARGLWHVDQVHPYDTIGRCEPAVICGACFHFMDPDAQRRGKNARYRGKRIERAEMRKAGVHTGNANKADDGQSVDGMFAYQSKSRATATFPGWQSAELDKLRTAHPGKVPVLVVVEAPGPGRKPRKLAVVEWAAWLELHGGTDR